MKNTRSNHTSKAYDCYYTRNAAGRIVLLVIDAKSVRASISGAVLKQLKELLDHDD
ncbi:MAG: hypothetical protein JZU64_15185 [Rhodoferax sp.]|jgi:hypothetical protein|nr:hypothetical protein [Rhodoferax sp.]